MANFFIRRPIVAIVIAIVTVIIGGITIALLPIAQFPNIARRKSGCKRTTLVPTQRLSSSLSLRQSNSKSPASTIWNTCIP